MKLFFLLLIAFAAQVLACRDLERSAWLDCVLVSFSDLIEAFKKV